MHRLSSSFSGCTPLFSMTIVLSMFGLSCFAQENKVPRTVQITASVPAPPPGITLQAALENFPENVAFNYDYTQKMFTTETRPFTVERTLSEEYNVTIQTNEGLVHENSSEVQHTLKPYLKVGGNETITNPNDSAKWCDADAVPTAITFAIEESDRVPEQGQYSGELVVVFEPASK